jgi:drug/metabolite transporter (DMT)-like permease
MAPWILWTLLTLLAWGVWAVLYKLFEGGISDAQLQAISTLGVLPVLVLLSAMPDRAPSGNRRRGIALALGSGIVSCLGNIAFYDVLSRGAKAAAVIPITDLYPVVTILLAVFLLKEKLNWLQTAGICLSIGAIYLFHISQEENLMSPWLLMALIPIVLWGVCGLMQKMATNHISGQSSAIWFLVAFLPVAAAIVVLDPLPSNIPIKTWAVAAAIGFMLALGNLTVLLAFASGGKASIITPLAGLYPLVSIPIAVFAFDERLSWREDLGIILALTAVVMLSCQSETAADANAATNTDPIS